MKLESARPFIDIFAPVAEALAAGKPVVALESTIITHGMPYPQNSSMAANVEAIIADEGAAPATIAVIDGRLKIGLSGEEREALAKTSGAMKLSRADLAYAIAEGKTGGTTVAATMIAAASCRHPGLCNRRHRRRAQGRRKQLRYLRRPRRTGQNAR